jgi:hypothetical protein
MICGTETGSSSALDFLLLHLSFLAFGSIILPYVACLRIQLGSPATSWESILKSWDSQVVGLPTWDLRDPNLRFIL